MQLWQTCLSFGQNNGLEIDILSQFIVLLFETLVGDFSSLVTTEEIKYSLQLYLNQENISPRRGIKQNILGSFSWWVSFAITNNSVFHVILDDRWIRNELYKLLSMIYDI